MKRFTIAFILLTTLLAINAGNKPFLTKVYDFMPAPGQFVNSLPKFQTGEPRDSAIARAQTAICGYYDIDDGDTTMVEKPGMISLGSYGGYVVVGFDHPVVNVVGEYDFQIFGNAYQASGATNNGSSEPGIVMVSRDVNGNGLPDDPWYELAGSEYNDAKTQHNFTVTYYKPTESEASDTYIKWTSNDVKSDSVSGYVKKNSFHTQSYWPQWADGETLSFTGSKLKNNAVLNGSNYTQYFKEWGYVDNRPDYNPYSSTACTEYMNSGFKIDWAVDAEGNPVTLKQIDFIKIYNGVLQDCGWLGETSTEVAGGVDFHPNAVAPSAKKGDITGDGNVDVSDVTALTGYILNGGTIDKEAADITGDGNIDVSDVTALINIILG